mmetsp:Transcript_1246/g.3871  ORF Transcript_1246/g.3871 Transcript_1246/m.3871 type:complete len:256 (+) Transcript_1246:651-1418(+)
MVVAASVRGARVFKPRRFALGVVPRVGDPDLYVLRPLQQPLEERRRARRCRLVWHLVVLVGLRLEVHLKVDEGLPQSFGHVQLRLRHRELVHRARARRLAHGGLERAKAGPGAAVGGRRVDELCVDLPAAVHFPELPLDFDVADVQLGLAQLLALAQRLAQEPAGRAHVSAPHLKLGGQEPQFGKRERVVRDHVQGRAINSARAVQVLGLELLVHGVVDPQVDVAPPVLFVRGRDVGNGALVRVAHQVGVSGALF